jgi:hypothetical protein
MLLCPQTLLLLELLFIVQTALISLPAGNLKLPAFLTSTQNKATASRGVKYTEQSLPSHHPFNPGWCNHAPHCKQESLLPQEARVCHTRPAKVTKTKDSDSCRETSPLQPDATSSLFRRVLLAGGGAGGMMPVVGRCMKSSLSPALQLTSCRHPWPAWLVAAAVAGLAAWAAR